MLALGIVRPYKQLDHAAEAAASQLERGCSSPVSDEPLPALDGAELRLGYLSTAELDRALGESTVAVFPYRAELDQSGALLQALGAGVPAVVYDVGGLGEPVRRSAPAGSSRQTMSPHWATRIRELLDDSAALAEARAGALRAREALSWDASARAHLELYGELA